MLTTSLKKSSVDKLPYDLETKKNKYADPQSKSLAALRSSRPVATKHLLSAFAPTSWIGYSNLIDISVKDFYQFFLKFQSLFQNIHLCLL